MFDLQYFKTLKKNKYIQQPTVNMLFVYEDIFLNIDKPIQDKISEMKERNSVLYTYMKNEGFPEYPCLYSEHHKIKNKIDKVLSLNDNIYIFVIINNHVDMLTKSKSSKDIKQIIYNNSVSQFFNRK